MSVRGYPPADRSIFLLQLEIRPSEVTRRDGWQCGTQLACCKMHSVAQSVTLSMCYCVFETINISSK